MSVTIITAFNSDFAKIGALCAASIKHYCKTRRGINFAQHRIASHYDRKPSWKKVDFIRFHLQHSEFVLWIDGDAMIVGNADIRTLLKPTTLNISKDENGINCGVMAWHRSTKAFELLKKIERLYTEFAEHPWWEQAALMTFIDKIDVTYQPKHVFNAYDYDHNPETLIRHWPGVSNEDRLQQMTETMKALC